MEPSSCYNSTEGIIGLLTMDGSILSYMSVDDLSLYSYLEFDNLQAGTYILKVMTMYGVNAVRDFTVKVYSAPVVNVAKLTSVQNSNFDMTQINLALANKGAFVTYEGESSTGYYDAYWGNGFGFSYL
jgi:hypothetical protein